MLKNMKKSFNETRTANGDKAYKSTNIKLLDFFSSSGAMRNSSEEKIIKTFAHAYSENKDFALKALFYSRDIREGQGERRVFKTILRYLANNYPEDIKHLIPQVPEYGTWQDIFVLKDTPLEKTMITIVNNQLFKDVSSENPSLLSKWMPSENTSSKESRNLARFFAKELILTPKEYRKMLSSLRAKINIVESKMSANKWNKINYSQVPSKAMMNYRNAFIRHNPIAFDNYLYRVKNGVEKINSSVLYPYEIYNKIMQIDSNDETLELQWNSLPDYVKQDENALVMADVSGSMHGLPMSVSVSLALYYAERNKGAFANHYISFSGEPELIEICGNNLYEKMYFIKSANVGFNTDLRKAFMKILDIAVKNNIPQSELPSKIYVISDMQFDSYDVAGNDSSTFEYLQKTFNDAGYNLPELVFWNVDGCDTKPITVNDVGVQLVSGFSPVLFKQVVSGLSPYELMIEILSSERYESIHI